jgi:hypothetical protein
MFQYLENIYLLYLLINVKYYNNYQYILYFYFDMLYNFLHLLV